MKLKSLKLAKSEKQAYVPQPLEDSIQYPWGTCIDLQNETLEKLGISKLPEVGTTMMLVAKVEVNRRSESESDGGKPQRSLSFQITEMALEPEADEKSAAKTLYGE